MCNTIINFSSLLIFLFVILISDTLFSQEVDIVPYLKEIESGNITGAQQALSDLKEKYPDDPSVMFLEGVLNENGQEAIIIYQRIIDDFPESKYADASLYRIFSYYYALGLYDTSMEKLKLLKSTYPASPYIQVAEQNLSMLEKSDVQETNNSPDENENPVEENYKYTIQAGAFINSDNAKKLKNDFENAGMYSHLKEKVVGGTTFHIVFVGKFERYEDAESFLQVVNSQYNINGTIVSYPQNQK